MKAIETAKEIIKDDLTRLTSGQFYSICWMGFDGLEIAPSAVFSAIRELAKSGDLTEKRLPNGYGGWDFNYFKP